MSDLTILIKSRNKNALAGVVFSIFVFCSLDLFLRGHASGFDAEIMRPIAIGGNAIGAFICWWRAAKAHAAMVNLAARQRSIEDRLDELERLKRRDMVTPEEYAAKRQEILKDL